MTPDVQFFIFSYDRIGETLFGVNDLISKWDLMSLLDVL